MLKNLRVLHVFLASPSDVAEERAAADDVVTSVNRIIGPQLGWQVELHKWEDTFPAFGRPQEIINRTLDDCELFIGLLWKWWGQPTGKYSSGFEEEFERARARRKAQGQPEICLFFKKLDPESSRDPGTQLAKVLEFRKSQIGLREVLFQEVENTQVWKTRLNELLLTHVLNLYLQTQIQQQPIAAAVAAPADPEVETSADATKEIPQQLRDLLPLLSRVIESGDLEFSRQDVKQLQEFEVARLFLLSATWMSRRYTGDLLGTHEMNLLYKHRKELEVTPSEEFVLLRTIVGHGDDVVPGWFWFPDPLAEKIADWLLVLASRDSLEGVRARALDILASAGIKIPKKSRAHLPLSDDSWTVRNKAYDYLVFLGDDDALSLLKGLEASKQDLSEISVREARFKLLARLDPAKAFADAIAEGEYISEADAQILRKAVSKVDDAMLLKGIESTLEPIRKLSVKELATRNHVPLELANTLTRDTSLAVRALALKSLAKQGKLPDFQEVRKLLSEQDSAHPAKAVRMFELLYAGRPRVSPDADSIIVSFYRTQPTEKLLQAVDWFSINGPLAYKALALDRYKEISSSIRADLANGFSRIKEESVKRRKSEYGTELWEKHATEFHKYDSSVLDDFTEAALTGLAANGQPSDVDLARPYLFHSDTSLRDAAVSVVSKFGGPGDVDALLKIATEVWGGVRRKAATSALKFSPKPVEVASKLMESSDSEVVKIGLACLYRQDSREVRAMFQSLLHDGSDTKRARGIYYCSRWMNGPELEQLLEDYLAEETYYYDVVTWLDRLLFSPKPLREMFVRNLKQKATDTGEWESPA